MKYSNNAMSTILLCSYLGISKESDLKPLTLSEWYFLRSQFTEQHLEPEILLNAKEVNKAFDIINDDFLVQRIKNLIKRGAAVAFELDELSRKGIEVVTQYEKEFPILLKRRLKKKCPPMLFYAGDISLSNKIGIAVVGSRNVDENGIEFTKHLVQKASNEKMIVYSGGARGVDTISEQTALMSGSRVVSFVADSLLSKIKNREVISALQEKQLLLFSDVKPDAGFSAARAMNRNKYIYASSYGAFVVSSDWNKGGTWAGAIENIRNKWTKTFVWEKGSGEGNLKLIEKGALAYEINNDKIYDLCMKKEESYVQEDLSCFQQEHIPNDSLDKELQVGESNQYNNDKQNSSVNPVEVKLSNNTDIYYIVKDYVLNQFKEATTLNEASEKLNVAKGQLSSWIKRLKEEGKLVQSQDKYLAQ